MSLKILSILLIVLVISLTGRTSSAGTANWCQEPWELLDANICLLLNSKVKTWPHANLRCKHEGGDLLYISNSEEQRIITNFFKELIRYRFSKQSNIWLNAVKKDDNWIWSQNNKIVDFNNWIGNVPFGSNKNCLCLKVANKKSSDWWWQQCDCNMNEHFVCRKAHPDSAEMRERQLVGFPVVDRETKSTESNHLMMDSMMREAGMSDLSVAAVGEASPVVKAPPSSSHHQHLVDELMKQTNFVRDSSLFINVYRTRVSKKSPLFRIGECPLGFGYYAVNKQWPPDCSEYKICQNWDAKDASIHVNRCMDGKIFSFKDFLCVDGDANLCLQNYKPFVPL